MPLQQFHTEIASPETSYSAPNTGIATNNTPANSARLHESNATETLSASPSARYDAATVRQIIALAEQMQARHRETLSAEEIETLGHEVGVETVFVRRARAEVEAQKIKAAAKTQTKSSGKTRLPRAKRAAIPRRAAGHALGPRQRELIVVPAALYYLLTAFAQNRVAVDTDTGFVVYFFAPLVIAFVAGFVARSKRVGALGGSLIGLALVGTLRNFVQYPSGMPTTHDVAAAVGVIVAAGTVGAALNQWLGRMRGTNKTTRRISPFILRYNNEV